MKITASTNFGVRTTRIYPFCEEGATPRPWEGYFEVIYGEDVRIDLNINASPMVVERAAQFADALAEAVRIAQTEEKPHE